MFDHGSLIFLAFLIIGFAGIVIGYFTRAGSGITPRPYGKVYGGAPGAKGRGEISGKDPKERYSSRGLR
jgi:hypothetical protein